MTTRVYLVVQGRVQERVVQLGEEHDGAVPVLAGAKADDVVVTKLEGNVKDGARVR